MMRRTTLLGTCALLFATLGCATSSAFRAGEKAERMGDFDRATLEYSKALKKKPESLDRTSRGTARPSSSPRIGRESASPGSGTRRRWFGHDACLSASRSRRRRMALSFRTVRCVKIGFP